MRFGGGFGEFCMSFGGGGVEDPNSLKELWRGRRFGGGWG